MSDLDDEETAAKLLRAAKDRGETPVHPAVGERMWKAIEAKRQAPAPRRRWLIPAASAAMLLVAIAFAAQQREPVAPKLEHGTAFLLDGGARVGITEPMLAWQTRVQAGDGTVFNAADARLVLSKDSVLVFLSKDAHALMDGSAFYEIEKGGIGFNLTMGPWEVRVTGTRFWVFRSARENVIEVYEGSVRLRTGAREIDLKAGDAFREWLGEVKRIEEVVEKIDPPAPAPHEPTLAEALSRVRAGKYAEAETMYRRIAEHTPAQAEVALYALAKMKLQKQRDVAAGLRLLDQLDRSHPKGPLGQERALTRIEALFRLARCDEAKAAVAAYVKEYTHAIESLREIDASQCAK